MGGKREEEEEEEKSKKKGTREKKSFCSVHTLPSVPSPISSRFLSHTPILKRYEANAITNIYLDVHFFLQSRESYIHRMGHSVLVHFSTNQYGAGMEPRALLQMIVIQTTYITYITIAISADHLARYIGQETIDGF